MRFWTPNAARITFAEVTAAGVLNDILRLAGIAVVEVTGRPKHLWSIYRKMRQNLGWAIGYNSLALPIAAGVFEPWGLTLRPEIAAISMSGSSVLVAVNALALKRLRLPHAEPRSARPTD
jgi:hypothetical protein